MQPACCIMAFMLATVGQVLVALAWSYLARKRRVK